MRQSCGNESYLRTSEEDAEPRTQNGSKNTSTNLLVSLSSNTRGAKNNPSPYVVTSCTPKNSTNSKNMIAPPTATSEFQKKKKTSTCCWFAHVKMHELFTREWQVLENRTHPLMNASLPLVQGFVLVGTLIRVDIE